MLARTLPALLAVCLVPLACTVNTMRADADAPKQDGSADSQQADPTDPDAAREDGDDKPARASLAADELPDCPAENGTFVVYCTKANKLAGRWMAVDALEIPDDVEIIFNAEGPDSSRQSSLLIATRGDELFIKHVTCGSCRRVLGQGFAGHLSHMSEDQILGVQAQLGLGDDVGVLATGTDWASFARDERRNEVLTEIATITEMRVGG
jgi:hypothetical protein